MNNEFSRRVFLRQAAFATGAAALGSSACFSIEAKMPAAIIGHSGKGDYGHGLDLIFNGRERIEVVAIADPEEAGRAKAAARCKALRQYHDYRQMLAKEKPRLVCVAPRWTDQHHAMGMRSEEHTSELQSHSDLVCRLLLEKKKKN